MLISFPSRRKSRARAQLKRGYRGDLQACTTAFQLLRCGRTQEETAMNAAKSITVNRSREDVYQFWRELGNLPRFMYHLKSVLQLSATQSHWTVKAPGGGSVEWDAQIIAERPDELISWRSIEGSDIRHEGSVRFRQAPGDRGTEVEVQLEYDAPGGSVGAAIATLFGEEPNQQLRDDLRRFKQVMETGEVVRSDGSLEGAGQGASQQRAAQAPEMEAR
jgi:uncharacterized membrane protein